MILVTLGTQKFQFDRLVETADRLAESTGREVFIQTGHSTYVPKHCKYQQFVDKEVFQKMISECEVLVTHSGVGSIMTGIRNNRPVIVVPRLKQFKEHVDDNQTEIAEAFAGKNYVLYCEDLSKLPELIEKAQTHKFDTYVECDGKIEDMIFDFLENC